MTAVKVTDWLWSFLLLTAGALCQEIIDQCDGSPCQNEGRCESRIGSYVCHCLQQSQHGLLYGGPDCTVLLEGCQGHECQNQAACSPFLMDGLHGYSCSCPPGYTGPLCQTPTAFSFERSGYLLLQSPLVAGDASCNISLSFRTALPRAVLFQRSSRGLVLVVELEEGRLRLTLKREAKGGVEGLHQALELSYHVTDGEWHSVEAILGLGLLSLKILDDGLCKGFLHSPCGIQVSVESSSAGVEAPETSLQSTIIGGVFEDLSGLGGEPAAPAFIGCVQDVFVDSQLVVPEDWLSDLAVNVTPGCSHRDRCLDRPCHHSGHCINLWQSFQCECPQPFDGQRCEEEHVVARFGNEDSPSYATFTVNDKPGPNVTVSLFLRTRRSTGLLLALANSTSRYLRMWLDLGRVAVQLHPLESLTGGRAVNDGEVHFVSLVVESDGVASLYVEAQQQGRAAGWTLSPQPGDLVHVGGLAEPGASSAFGGHFKGCVQDLRMNDKRLQFFGLDVAMRSYPLESMANVTPGCTGDNACSKKPCLNGGLCYSVWDDFNCTCPPNTAGRHCEEVQWCELSPCPAEAECRLLSQGYECFSNATFLEDSSVLSYRGNGLITRTLTSLSFGLRTRNRHAVVLHAERGPEFVTVSVQNGLLFLELQSGPAYSVVRLSSRRRVSDGRWHIAHLFMAAPWAETSPWTLVLDQTMSSTSSAQGGNLDFMRDGVDILLGGLGPGAGWSFTGCLGTLEVGGIALPYFSSSEVNLPRTQEEQFLRTSSAAPRSGCSGAPVCQPSPCLNGGACQDLFNLFSCSCQEGWVGRRCELTTDTCASNPCVHGNCSIRGLAYECACDFGFSGVNCEEEVDMCERHRCAHGATCLHGVNTYACLCAENFTGPYCTERVEEIPWYIMVPDVWRPKLPVSVCGDEHRNYTCFNGGNCTEDFSCICVPGFIGQRCEQEVDECKSNPCLNGGYCRNHINRFRCVCDMAYAGELCQTDVSDVYFYVAVLLWQNLFQLLSYLILRLDDEPEMEWGVNDEV